MIPVSKIGEAYKKDYETFLRLLILETDQAIKLNTPVDSGRMRQSWQVGQDGPKPGDDPAEKYEGGRKDHAVKDAKFIGFTHPTIGHDYSLHNNLPYAEANAGYVSGFPPSWGGQFRSKKNQVKLGWLEQIKKDLQTEAPKLWDAVQKRRR